MTTTGLPMTTTRDWHDAFQPGELDALRRMIPAGIHAAQARTGRANTEYADPEGELDVYGVGMSKAAAKEIRALIRTLPSYHELTIPKTSRRLMFVGRALIFPIRVGEKMRRDKSRLWLRSFSESRQKYLGENSTTRRAPEHTALFETDATASPITEETGVIDALKHVEDDAGRSELFVAYFSSSPLGVGQIMWAPAHLDGRHLQFLDAETLSFRKTVVGETAAQKPQVASGFASSARPRTSVKRRPRPTTTTDPGH
ncbi:MULTISPECIES: hypothetical protein [unclassified Curtobacterium]|uniref:hypothetical protein n=1 Tax=unclassified Curtobacterium TaxID=257496 RepID=UPI000DA8FC33|nr:MULTISPECIES: hypothetical protein [unclassified Curtobacterium]PZE64208.1 hypothetical protein DEJ12_17010 [Curtobacterium sp. MCLR17_059]PZF45693.1 hypothetical protein DEJ10_17325 [Curtobacterium sp. MCLR17_057]